jgi:hypothetical protein
MSPFALVIKALHGSLGLCLTCAGCGRPVGRRDLAVWKASGPRPRGNRAVDFYHDACSPGERAGSTTVAKALVELAANAHEPLPAEARRAPAREEGREDPPEELAGPTDLDLELEERDDPQG